MTIEDAAAEVVRAAVAWAKDKPRYHETNRDRHGVPSPCRCDGCRLKDAVDVLERVRRQG